MEYASVTGYSTEPLNFFSANELLDGSEPISVVQNTYKDPIVIKEILMDSLQGKEILPIDDKDYKNKEVDEMISKMNEFTETFHKLQT